ncbi:hypothetical protein EIN_371400 [Entamoeba invadens IP1]|uniref:Uncharacterized protein n=1 Tax=Entamoeba invadens IP1 TaxID=370355 RepID=A0A0A1UC67_ENTIV|nr:hypothetical protein EIN_371400 [Entamoeba invadens IP1]ELP92728.1 hypothetical protein EIN_371400 [Entamoeba invadens IP1]|eukprot:XP_004259499.1 hypothetical protein EIN_371400 [Entamoeba invadens IP1]
MFLIVALFLVMNASAFNLENNYDFSCTTNSNQVTKSATTSSVDGSYYNIGFSSPDVTLCMCTTLNTAQQRNDKCEFTGPYCIQTIFGSIDHYKENCVVIVDRNFKFYIEGEQTVKDYPLQNSDALVLKNNITVSLYAWFEFKNVELKENSHITIPSHFHCNEKMSFNKGSHITFNESISLRGKIEVPNNYEFIYPLITSWIAPENVMHIYPTFGMVDGTSNCVDVVSMQKDVNEYGDDIAKYITKAVWSNTNGLNHLYMINEKLIRYCPNGLNSVDCKQLKCYLNGNQWMDIIPSTNLFAFTAPHCPCTTYDGFTCTIYIENGIVDLLSKDLNNLVAPINTQIRNGGSYTNIVVKSEVTAFSLAS